MIRTFASGLAFLILAAGARLPAADLLALTPGSAGQLQRAQQAGLIYSGHPNGPAGVFRITRTLDTPKQPGRTQP